MTGRRARASLSIAAVLAGVASTVAVPIAHAQLDNIRATVNRDRSGSPCPAYTYSGFLEGAAQKYARTEAPLDSQAAGYNGQTIGFLGSGDPTVAATTSAYSRGAGNMITTNCDFTEFGVGMVRHDDREVSVVTIMFGKPAAPPPPPPPVEVKPPEPEEAPAPPPAEAKPLQGPTVTADEGLTGVTFIVTDRSGVTSQCTYSSEGFNKGFALPANGTVEVFVPAIRMLRERTGTITCDNGTSTPTSVFY